MEAWKEYDASELLALGYPGKQPILIDVGTADANLAVQLKPERFEEAAKKAGVQVRMAGNSRCLHVQWRNGCREPRVTVGRR